MAELTYVDCCGPGATSCAPSVAPRAVCRLDDDALRAQLDRYRRIAAHVETAERSPGRVMARLADGVPLNLLEEALEVERGCCPFIEIAYERRMLTFTVAETGRADPGAEAMLDALFDALRPPARG